MHGGVKFVTKELFKRGYIKNKKDFVTTYFKVDEKFHTPNINHLFSSEKILNIVFKKLGESLSKEVEMNFIATYRIFIWDHIEPDLELQKLFKSIKNKEIKIGILTDGTTIEQYEILERLGVLRYINSVVTSEEVGAEKPSTKMYKKIISKLSVVPDKILMVGDNFERDIKGAKNYGMKTVYLIRGKIKEIKKNYCDVIISDIKELKKYLF